MDRVTLLMLGALTIAPCAWPVPGVVEPVDAAQDPLDRWQPFIAEAADRFDIPAAWIRAVMQAESGGRTTLDGSPITSRAGAMGLRSEEPTSELKSHICISYVVFCLKKKKTRQPNHSSADE